MIDYKLKQKKLQQLCELEGLSEEDVIGMAFSSTVIGICRKEHCDYTTDVEPDQTGGWCEECNTKTVESAISLMGLI